MIAPLPDLTGPGIVLVAFLAVLHASFQLGTSVLTLLSGHSLIHHRATHRILLLNSFYIIGSILTTALILGALTTIIYLWLPYDAVTAFWAFLSFAAMIVGLMVVMTYYRRGKGTRLWIPRAFADYLIDRAHKTKNPIEAMALGVISVIAELPFTLILFAMTSMVFVNYLVLDEYTAAIGIYSVAVTIPLFILTSLIAGGHRLSTVQRWRESSKVFLQYAAGAGLVAAALYALAYFVLLQEQP